jgi:hypothetical protein
MFFKLTITENFLKHGPLLNPVYELFINYVTQRGDGGGLNWQKG